MPSTTSSTYWPGWDIARGVALVPGSSTDGYILDGWGGVHPFGNAPVVTLSAYWPGWNIARGIVVNQDGKSGYVLDGWGMLHPFAAAGTAMPATPAVSAYWPGWDIARGITFVPGSSTQGYVLDGWGGTHPFGGAPGLAVSGYYPGHDVARGLKMIDAGDGYVGLATGVTIAAGAAPPVLTNLMGLPIGHSIA
jgi:hypothetical protein